MLRFATALRTTARVLAGPAAPGPAGDPPADLGAAYEDRRGQGVPEPEGVRCSAERNLGSSGMVRRLARLHAGPGPWGVQWLGARLREGTGRVRLSDRLLHLCDVLIVKGRSYRLRDLERQIR